MMMKVKITALINSFMTESLSCRNQSMDWFLYDMTCVMKESKNYDTTTGYCMKPKKINYN